MKYAFDMEQQILDCWNVTKDVNLLMENVLDRGTPLTEDELSNVLLGISSIYELKFEKLFRTYESLIKEYYDQRKQGE